MCFVGISAVLIIMLKGATSRVGFRQENHLEVENGSKMQRFGPLLALLFAAWCC
jgi:hypothetical protein